MCELFGLSSAEKVNCNELLRTFFSHGETNPDGWTGATQGFERARFEAHPEKPQPFKVLLGRLGAE